MNMPPVQTFNYEDRIYDGLSHGVLVVEESSLLADVADPIRVLYGDDGEECDDYIVHLILRLQTEENGSPRVAVYFSDSN